MYKTSRVFKRRPENRPGQQQVNDNTLNMVEVTKNGHTHCPRKGYILSRTQVTVPLSLHIPGRNHLKQYKCFIAG